MSYFVSQWLVSSLLVYEATGLIPGMLSVLIDPLGERYWGEIQIIPKLTFLKDTRKILLEMFRLNIYEAGVTRTPVGEEGGYRVLVTQGCKYVSES